MYCSKCGEQIPDNSQFCPKCGASCNEQGPQYNVNNSAPYYENKQTKSRGLATVLSILIVGVGQMYLGQVVKGIVMLIGAMVIGAITGGLAALPIWILSAIDAYRIATKINEGKTVGEWEFF